MSLLGRNTEALHACRWWNQNAYWVGFKTWSYLLHFWPDRSAWSEVWLAWRLHPFKRKKGKFQKPLHRWLLSSSVQRLPQQTYPTSTLCNTEYHNCHTCITHNACNACTTSPHPTPFMHSGSTPQHYTTSHLLWSSPLQSPEGHKMRLTWVRTQYVLPCKFVVLSYAFLWTLSAALLKEALFHLVHFV